MARSDNKKFSWVRLGTKAMVALLLFTIFVAPLQGLTPKTQAQETTNSNGQLINPNTGATVPTTASSQTAYPSNTLNSSGQATAPTANGGGGTTPDINSCWSSSWGTCFANVVYVFTVGLMSVFAYIGSYVFDIAIQLTLQTVTYSQSFLTQGWAAVRDLANMAFIFILVYIAIIIVLRADTSSTMKMLVMVVVMALLINFSFFISRVAIDAGNILAVQFYNAIQAPSLAQSGSQSGLVGTIANATSYLSPNSSVKDLTANIMNLIGIQTFIGSNSFNTFANGVKNGGGGSIGGGFTVLIALTFIYIAVAAILAILAFVFIIVGIKFLIRIVALWFAIIAAPLAFVAKALPNKVASSMFDRWQRTLVEYSFYPAVFLFIFWVINNFAYQLGNTNGGLLAASFKDAGAAAQQGAFLLPIATVVSAVTIRLGIIVLMLWVAMQASSYIAKGANGIATNVSGWMGGKMAGTLGWAGRNSFGWAGNKYAQSTMGRRFASTNVLGRTLWRGAGKVGDASFDVRNSSKIKKGVSTVTKVDLGAGVKGGYKSSFDTRVAKRKGDAEKLSKATDKQLDDAYQKAVENLPEDKKTRLLAFYENFKRDEELYNNGQISETGFRRSRTAFENELKSANAAVSTEASNIAGTNNAGIYASSIEKRNWGNLGGILSPGIPGFVSKSDKEAALQIRGRGGKDATARLRDMLDNEVQIDPAAVQAQFQARQNPPTTPAAPQTQAASTVMGQHYGRTGNPNQPMNQTGAAQTPMGQQYGTGVPVGQGGGGGPQNPPQNPGGGVHPRYTPQQNINNVLGWRQQRALRETTTPDVLGTQIGRRDDIGTRPSPASAPVPNAPVTAPSVTPKQLEELQKGFTKATEKMTKELNDVQQEHLELARRAFQEARKQTKATQAGFSTLRESLLTGNESLGNKIESGLTQNQNQALHGQPSPGTATSHVPTPPPKPVPSSSKPVPPQPPSEGAGPLPPNQTPPPQPEK